MSNHSSEYNQQLTTDIGGFVHNPLGFVKYSLPWEEGNIEEWQRNLLLQIGADLQSDKKEALRYAVASGHGIGKSALVSWLILWSLCTCPDTKVVVTANTETQLKGKTWAELSKWHGLNLCKNWFECTATALISTAKGHDKIWRADIVPWSERNTEAFAGLHNKGKRILLVFDEASAIPDSIWKVSEGALTDDNTEILWLVCGNPTRNSGAFFECFHRFRHRWHTMRVDSRNVSLSNKEQIAQWLEDYGEDSDFVRVRVKGEFPRVGANQLISTVDVEKAMKRTVRKEAYWNAPKIMGVDVARFGEDKSAIVLRQGVVLLKPIKRLVKQDTMQLAGFVAQEIEKEQPDGVFIDSGAMGTGVIDRLVQLGFGRLVTGVDFGSRATDSDRFFNKRAEMWCKMASWLRQEIMLPNDDELKADLTAPQYFFSGDRGQIQLEKKADIKKRGLASPDSGDALALTFAYPVRKKSDFLGNGRKARRAVQESNL